MAETPDHTLPETARGRETGALLLAIGGLAAAFGAASCCALPLLLASLGLGSAWIVAVAWVAAPHRLALLAIATVCLAGVTALLLWRRSAILVCATGSLRRRQVIATLGMASVAALLAVLGVVYA